MIEVFRKHYSYGETIPILDTHVGMTVDLYEVTGKSAQSGPYIKAVFIATAGPMKSLPLIVEPIDNESKVIHISNIPVPIPKVRTVDLSLIFDLANYRWTASPESPRDTGLVTFDLRLRAAFSVLGKSYTLLLDQRPCSITLTKQQMISMQAPYAQERFEPQTATQPFAQQQFGQIEAGNVPYGSSVEERQPPSPVNGGSQSPATFTNQLDIEERLRQLSTKLLTHS